MGEVQLSMRRSLQEDEPVPPLLWLLAELHLEWKLLWKFDLPLMMPYLGPTVVVPSQRQLVSLLMPLVVLQNLRLSKVVLLLVVLLVPLLAVQPLEPGPRPHECPVSFLPPPRLRHSLFQLQQQRLS